MRIGLVGAMLALVGASCGQPVTGGGSGGDTASSTETEAVPRCDEVVEASAPAEWYRDEPVYVGNEMPVEQVRDWAQQYPGFEEVWIDRDHNGWIALAFSQQAEQRQLELTERFPDVGAAVVPVDWTMEELHQMQEQVVEAFADEEIGSGISVTQGVVTIDFGVLTDERYAAVVDRFGGQRVCVSGRDLADAPTPGPQPTAGEAWRLLADAQGEGESYRTGIATDETSYVALWEQIGLSQTRPPVDFDRDVVIWFGAVFGSSCPDLRLDDVVVDREQALVHADIVLVDPPTACTDDANPHAYVVALERQELPEGPFRIQLGAEDPPRGVPEERTYVDVDLSVAGAVADPSDLRTGQPSDVPPDAVSSGDVIETGFPRTYQMRVECGVEWLGVLNDVTWQARDPGSAQQLPAAWEPAVESDGTVLVEVTIETGSPPVATARLNGEELAYVPAEASIPACP